MRSTARVLTAVLHRVLTALLTAGLLSLLIGGCASRAIQPRESPPADAVPAPTPAAAAPGTPETPKAPAAAPAQKPVSAGTAIERGTNWLLKKQNPDGGYGPSVGAKGVSDAGITAFALYALARSPRGYKEHDGPSISKAVEFLTSRQQPDGGIYDPLDPSLQNYKTSVSILALSALDPVKYAPVIRKAVEFVKAEQFTEEKGFEKDKHAGYGGIGYGGDPLRPDLSNVNVAGDALQAAGVSGSDELWVRLQVFLSRCQNAETVDPVVKAAGVGTTKDGGLRYAPTSTRGNAETIDGEKVFSSYGSMTYAGLKSFLHAQVKRDDPRVQAAFRWIQSHFTVKENPGMATPSDPSKGQQGLYYYYHTMAKALATYGEPVIVDERGQKHDWAKELGEEIASRQHPEGYWDNPVERWMEGIEVLDTSYALVALATCQDALRAKP